MDITQGKWEVEECRGLFTVITDDEPICVFYLLQEEDHHYQEFENAEANAKELVRRWNAFEKDGLVDELRDVCEAVKLRIHFIGWPSELMNKDGPDWSKEVAMLEAAIAKVT